MKRAAVAIIALTFIVLSATEITFANAFFPIFPNLESPINNQVYPTNTVEIRIKQNTQTNFTKFTITKYVLDNQPPISTNSTSTVVLSNLSPGSHTLELCGTCLHTSITGNKTYVENFDCFVYFGVIYSTQMVIFSFALTLVLVVIGLILYRKRRQIKVAFEGKKRDIFVVGLLLLVFFFLPTVGFALYIANIYLFPVWLIELEL